MYTVFCDGACSGNPGPGGWAFRIKGLPDGLVDRSGNGGRSTTNNRMELSAAIAALEHLADLPGPVTVRTDSRYVIDGITSWIHGWKRNGWQTSSKKPVLNEELWRRLDALNATRRPKVDWLWVKGHAGHDDNEAVDRLAVEAAQGREVGGGKAVPVPAPAVPASAPPAWLLARAATFRSRIETAGGTESVALLVAFDEMMAMPTSDG